MTTTCSTEHLACVGKRKVLQVVVSHFRPNRKWKYGGERKNEVSTIDFLFDPIQCTGLYRSPFRRYKLLPVSSQPEVLKSDVARPQEWIRPKMSAFQISAVLFCEIWELIVINTIHTCLYQYCVYSDILVTHAITTAYEVQ